MNDEPRSLCLLGLDGMNPPALLDWLGENRWLILLDDKPLDLPEELLFHPRVRKFQLETPLQQGVLANEIAWHTVFQALEIRGAPRWGGMRRQIEELHQSAHLLLSEVADFGVAAFANARSNWRSSAAFRSLAGLKGRFAGVPAIVCGAGPSLDEARPLLASLESKALLLAAGTALPIFGEFGIVPHFGFALDKETPAAPLLRQPFAEIPYCLQSRLPPACLTALHGEKILAPESGPLPWEHWWIGEERDSFGWTVANFATKIAVWMGCNPIVWAGMDLCYKDGRKYAQNLSQEAVPLIAAKNRLGEPVWTQRDWLMAARWSEEIADKHPEIRFINTSLSGLPLAEPIETRSLSSLSFANEFDLLGRVHAAVQAAPELSLSSIRQKEAEWEESRERCQAQCGQFSAELDLSGEPVYDYYLAPLWQIWQPLLAREALGQNMEWHRLLFFQQVLQELSHV